MFIFIDVANAFFSEMTYNWGKTLVITYKGNSFITNEQIKEYNWK